MSMNLNEVKKYIAELFEQCDCIPSEANVELANDTPNLTIVIYCNWMLVEPKPSNRKSARKVTLQLVSGATQLFIDADDVAREKIAKVLQNIVQGRLRNGCRANDPQNAPFVIRIDEHDLI